MEYRKNKKGEPISILGYGCMRFTSGPTGIDIDKAEKEIMTAFESGVNYFDTPKLLVWKKSQPLPLSALDVANVSSIAHRASQSEKK